MSTPICSRHTLQSEIFQGNDPKAPSFCQRFSLNWDKVFVFSNSALIVAGIAIAYFMKLPLLVLGLGAYGAASLLIKSLANRQTKDETKHAEKMEEEERIKKLAEIENKIETAQTDLARYNEEAELARGIRNESLSREEIKRIHVKNRDAAVGKLAKELVKKKISDLEAKNEQNSDVYKCFMSLARCMAKEGKKFSRA